MLKSYIYVFDWSHNSFNWKLYHLLVWIKRTCNCNFVALNKISCLWFIRIKCGNNNKLYFYYLKSFTINNGIKQFSNIVHCQKGYSTNFAIPNSKKFLW